jgi:tight adherence protein C
MTLLFILGVVLLGVAASLALRAATSSNLRVAAQLREIEKYGFGSDTAPETPIPSILQPRLPEQVGRAAVGRLSSIKPIERRELMSAGIYGLTAESLHGYRVLGALGLPLLTLGLGVLGGSLSPVVVLLGVAMGIAAWFLPAAHVRKKAQRRLDQIDRHLPDLIDVLTVTIEAGLGFAGSLQLVADRFDGPLGDELRLTLQEQTMGLSTQAALSKMRERCDTPSVRAFVRAVLQGESLGVSIATLLRNVATETRKRRRALAREEAQRAPLKLLFPLIFLIFPAMLIVLMFPAAYNIIHALGG